MESNVTDQFNPNTNPLPEKPEFLKILCILSFVGCGISILLFGLGIMTLGLNEEAINSVWATAKQSQPKLENLDPVAFFHQVGIVSLYNFILNIISLLGVIFMWRLNKMGLLVYAAAEIAANFFGLSMNTGEESTSNGGTIFMIALDLVFIVMYALNLKHMNKENQTI
jgi:hypothetical protein